MLQKHHGCTCRGCPQDHWLGPGNAQVPDSIPVAHILLEQLAQSSRSCGGFKAGHNLSRGDGEKIIREPMLQPQIKDGCILDMILLKEISAARIIVFLFWLQHKISQIVLGLRSLNLHKKGMFQYSPVQNSRINLLQQTKSGTEKRSKNCHECRPKTNKTSLTAAFIRRAPVTTYMSLG